MRQSFLLLAVVSVAVALPGCYALRPSNGGGETSFTPPRIYDPTDIAVPDGYAVELVASDLTFPTGVTFDAAGVPHVVEAGYSYGEVFTVPRLLRINAGGQTSVVAEGNQNGPWTGAFFHNGLFYIAEGGVLEGGRILSVTPEGQISTILEGLPSLGDHHTNGPLVSDDGWIYFGQGAATNSAVVGPDNADFGWLARFPEFHDIPGEDIVLTGINFESEDARDGEGTVVTGAFLPYGTPSQPNQIIPGGLPCTGAIMRVTTAGDDLELVAWGFRNPFALAFGEQAQLYVVDNGYDNRGDRPVWATPDLLYVVTPDVWYGWPDFAGGRPLTLQEFKPPRKSAPRFLIANHPNVPPEPVARLGVHSAATGVDFSTSAAFGHVGDAFITEFGDQAPTTDKLMGPVGFRVVRVEVDTGAVHGFMENKGAVVGPGSKFGGSGLERPCGLRFSPDGSALYVVDFGVLTQTEEGAEPRVGTGALWRIVRAQETTR